MTFSEVTIGAMESLLVQSMHGVHHLFDNDNIKKILRTPTEELDFFSFDKIDRIQDLFSTFMEIESFEAKKAYLSKLNEEEYEILVRTYFHIVESSILASTPSRH